MTQDIVMSPVGLETKNRCAGEGQQQFSSQADSGKSRKHECNNDTATRNGVFCGVRTEML
jgi:hypothetical protein